MYLPPRDKAVSYILKQKAGESVEVYESRIKERRRDIDVTYGPGASQEFWKNYLMKKHKDHPRLAELFANIARLRKCREKQEALFQELEWSLLVRVEEGLPFSGTMKEVWAAKKAKEEDGVPAD